MNYTNSTYITVDGFRLATYASGPENGPAIVLIHGWPELAYSWKPTIPALVDAGYRVVAYDLLGFGHSEAPDGLEHYRIENLVGHLEAVLDAFGLSKAILVGHDWGGIILWHAVRMLEHRTKAAISISTPHVGRAPVDPMAIFEKRFGKVHYFIEFRDRPEEVQALFASDALAFFRLMFRKVPAGFTLTPEMTHIPKRYARYLKSGAPSGKELVMSEDDLQVYAEAYARNGFLPGMNYYRNTTHNWKLAEGLSTMIRVPSLMISPEEDIFLPPSSTDGMVKTVPDLTRKTLPGCGHWTMWEAPETLNATILDWLEERGFSPSP